jgi:hypothetical protein
MLAPEPDTMWWWLGVGSLFVVLIGAATGTAVARAKQPKRLSRQSREEVLADVRKWLRAPEGL